MKNAKAVEVKTDQTARYSIAAEKKGDCAFALNAKNSPAQNGKLQ
jgi:hypothetical protein